MKSLSKFKSLFFGIVLGLLVSSVFSQTFQSPAYANEQDCATSSDLRNAVSEIQNYIIIYSN